MSVIILTVDEVMRTLSSDGQYPFVVNDKEVDIVRFALNTGFTDVVLDEHSALRVMYQRPGETEVRAKTLTYHDTDGLRNYYDWQLLSADLSKKGTLTVALCILRTDGDVEEWHTTPYQIRVLGSIHTDDSDEGDETITPTVAQRVAVLETMIQRVASGAPIVVASTSAMTDTDQIYVLSTDRKWYYHNGATWVAGGEYGAVATDTTLTQPGVPADAKKTGDEITTIKADLDENINELKSAIDTAFLTDDTISTKTVTPTSQWNNIYGTIAENNTYQLIVSNVNTSGVTGRPYTLVNGSPRYIGDSAEIKNGVFATFVSQGDESGMGINISSYPAGYSFDVAIKKIKDLQQISILSNAVSSLNTSVSELQELDIENIIDCDSTIVDEQVTIHAEWNTVRTTQIEKGNLYKLTVGDLSASNINGYFFIVTNGVTPHSLMNAFTLTEGYTFEFTCEYDNVTGIGLHRTNSSMDGETFTLTLELTRYYETLYSLDRRLGELELNIGLKQPINCFGDSITLSVYSSATGKRYPNVLSTMLTTKRTVNNFGVSGATMANITGRMCAIPVFLSQDVVFGSGVTSVTISDQNVFKSGYPTFETPRNSMIINNSGYPDFNPCLIDGHKCELTFSGTSIVITLLNESGNITLHSGSQLYFHGGIDALNGVNIVMMGTNGTYDDAEDYVAQYQKVADYCKNGRFLFLSQFTVHYTSDGTYQAYKTAQLARLDKIKANEVAMRNAFGNRFVNMREQLILHGLEYAIDGGLLTGNALSDANNLDAIANEIVPFGDDYTESVSNLHNGLLYNTHPNDAGYYAIAKIIHNALVGLGYAD